MQTKVLIIKLGYSETLDPEIGAVPSLGDVLRTTPLLAGIKERFPDSHITWLVAREAEPLLNGNKLVDRILCWDSFVGFQLMREKFDILINLEKIPGICALSEMIDAWSKYGYRFDAVKGEFAAYEKGLDFISHMQDKRHGKPQKFWQQVLLEMLDVEWRGQEYVLGYKPPTQECFDVGLNFAVGKKWPHKALPEKKWKDLEQRLLKAGLSVSWQTGHENLYEYMDWINQNRLIVSNDSLGLHLAFALKKKAVGLFGPTHTSEIYFYRNSRAVISRCDCDMMPCYLPYCATGLDCMNHISLDELEAAVYSLLEENKTELKISVHAEAVKQKPAGGTLNLRARAKVTATSFDS
jgi:heptosyltransferase-2